jgi:hypothetical protein
LTAILASLWRGRHALDLGNAATAVQYQYRHLLFARKMIEIRIRSRTPLYIY